MVSVARLQGAGVSLGGIPVLRHVDLSLPAGAVIGVSGPNGSGKTTLLRLLATLLHLDEGRGEVLGADLTTDQVFAIRRSIGLIGHQPALIAELTLRENLTHMARLAGEGESRVGQVLEVVGLDEAGDRRADASSFGMKRRVEVAHLLLTRPRLVLLDEAFAGLDESAHDLISALTRRVVAEGGAVVMVSHDHGYLTRLCDSVFALSMGRLEGAA